MDILLINPRGLKFTPGNDMPPLGLASIGCVSESEGFSVSILDLEIEPEDFDLSAYIKAQAPKIVGIGGTSHSRFESFRIAGIAKSVSSEILTVYGGCHASFTAEDTLSRVDDIDIVVRGEGEVTFRELAKSFLLKKGDIGQLSGLSGRMGRKIFHNPSRDRISDLDSLSYSRHLLKMDRYFSPLDILNIPSASIMTSRGCPYDCYFCSASTMFGRVCTRHSAEYVVDEMEYCKRDLKIRGIKIFDSTFTTSRQHVVSIAEEMIKRKLGLPWECEIRADTVDREMLSLMKKAGCYYVDFAVESASGEVSKTIGKEIPLTQAESVLRWCNELDIKTKVFFSFGHVGETMKSALKTLAYIEKRIDLITIPALNWGVRIYPGTRLERYALEHGLLSKEFSWAEPFKDPEGFPFTAPGVPVVLQESFQIREFNKALAHWDWILERRLYGRFFTPEGFKNLLLKAKEKLFSGGLLKSLKWYLNRFISITRRRYR